MTAPRRSKNPLLLAVLLACGAPLLAHAQVPATTPLTYSGEVWVNGSALEDGTYTFSLEFLDAQGGRVLCGDTGVIVTAVTGRFTHQFADGSCTEVIAEWNDELWIRIAGQGGMLGTSPVQLGTHRIATGAYALRAHLGGGSVGDIVASMLTEAQFQAQRGPGWRLADGGPCATGSAYEALTGSANTPDLRGMFLRGKQHDRADTFGNPDDLALGARQGDALKRHNHRIGPNAGPQVTGTGIRAPIDGSATAEVTGGFTGDTGLLEETRPQNVTVNYFIRCD